MKEKEIKELKKLIEKEETETVEFKSGLSEWRDALGTLAAFSWAKGGRVIFGISPTKKIIGIKLGKGTIESLANSIKQNTDPKLYPSIKVFKVEGKDIILVEVEKVSSEPIFAFGKAYRRVGKSTHQISREEYKRVIRDLYEQEFDGRVCGEASLKDIDWEAVNRFRERYEEINKTVIKGSNKELLNSLKCIKKIHEKIKITNAGILLFGKKPENFFPMSYVTVARYPGIERGAKYLDIKDFYGNLFEVIDSVDSYIREHTQEISEVVEGQIARKVIPQYPYFAIRELITNAICHRDYTNRGSRVVIRMFKNRIEFNSPGKLPADVTPENIIYEQYSRNPVIADILHRVKYIEKMGEGWDKIIDSLKKHPYKPKLPNVMDTGSTVIVTLFSPGEMVERELDEMIIKKLNERQKKALQYLKIKKKITRKEYVELNKCTEVTAKRDLSNLTKEGVLKRIGKTGKYTHYILNFNGSSNRSSNGSSSVQPDRQVGTINGTDKRGK